MSQFMRVGFLGAGGIAQAHAYALDAMKFYYADAPQIEKVVVASPTSLSRESFAQRFGFSEAIPPDKIWQRDDLDALYLLGPNDTHTPQLLAAVQMPHLKRIFVEKPLGVSYQDLDALDVITQDDHGKFIVMGFQYLQKSAIRAALAHWKSGVFGEPVHFRAEYLHSSYLDSAYRQKHKDRLQPAPINGAVADLGSHSLSLLVAFLGKNLAIRSAAASGGFEDVPQASDLCTTALIEDLGSGAFGTLVSSRISAGTGDHFTLEIYGTEGTLRFNTSHPDSYLSYLPLEGWRQHDVNSDYQPHSKFPSDYMPSGWLRALVHHHYLFLGGDTTGSFIPDLTHGMVVQKLLMQIASHLHSN